MLKCTFFFYLWYFAVLSCGMYEYIEIWYNNSRIHSKIGFTSPNEYEESMKKGNKEIA